MVGLLAPPVLCSSSLALLLALWILPLDEWSVRIPYESGYAYALALLDFMPVGHLCVFFREISN